MPQATGDGMVGILSPLFESERCYGIDSDGSSRGQVASEYGRASEDDEGARKRNRIIWCDSVEPWSHETGDRRGDSRTKKRSNQDEAGAVTGYQEQKILS
jgi:hypothetical protein